MVCNDPGGSTQSSEVHYSPAFGDGFTRKPTKTEIKKFAKSDRMAMHEVDSVETPNEISKKSVKDDDFWSKVPMSGDPAERENVYREYLASNQQEQKQHVQATINQESPKAITQPNQKPSTANSSSRFTRDANGVITDSRENKQYYEASHTWDQARDWVQGLSVGGGGWQLATMEELRKLYPEAWPTGFFGFTGYWSPDIKDGSTAWTFDIRDGQEVWLYRNTYGGVLAVRSRR